MDVPLMRQRDEEASTMHVGFQIQGKLTELVFDFSFEDAVAELSSMNARLSLYRN